MNLRQLKHFVAVAEELHFARAAARLNMTQPPLSMSIRSLEQSIGAVLFDRGGKRVALTPAGQVWLGHARRLLADAEALPQIARRAARGETGVLRLSFVSIASFTLLPDLVCRYRRARPDVRVELREATSDVQVEALEKGEIDAGIVIRPAGAFRPPLAHRRLLCEPLVAAVPAAWAAQGRDRVDFGSLADAPLILFPRHFAPAYYDKVADCYAAQGRPMRIFQEAIQMPTILGMVAAGLGISLVPRSMLGMERAGVRYLALDGDVPEIEVCMIWSESAALPVLQPFLALLDESGPDNPAE
ncbi:HTH-type transcriptional regulator BenM (plasmid) [Sulfitobacter sp. THAF37]|uniref:LysR family transcriptional regulator n=1 Tax=Sulfitobacter sp. THAF37 TaxID=2587855 RepID=UPI001267A01B|nr:LysR family transcriptional regulator [Sulfitobacter sp. THAF37]QFT61143.1 HTH-type transcriptional regulator BenM [Sulfitobacter sp. THAF37]